MKPRHSLLCIAMALVIGVGLATSVSATTLIRASLEELTATNSLIVVGEVLDTHSYWNKDETFILTDVRVAAIDVLKGSLEDSEVTVTIMGGTVGELTTVILGGPEFAPKNSYLLFLNEEILPGARTHRTVRDHCQGIFDVVMRKGALFAVSQANGQPLLPDASGLSNAPGSVEGLPLDTTIRSIRKLTGRPRR